MKKTRDISNKDLKRFWRIIWREKLLSHQLQLLAVNPTGESSWAFKAFCAWDRRQKLLKARLARARLTPIQRRLGMKVKVIAPGIELWEIHNPYFYTP